MRRATARGYASGVLFMTFFGALWASLTDFGLGPVGRVLLLSVVAIISVALLIAVAYLLRAARRLPPNRSADARARGKDQGRRFLFVLGIEFAAIALASYLLGVTGRAELIPPVVGLLVGLHFLPLASVFGVRLYYLTGTLMTLIAAVAVIALLSGITPGGAFEWSAVVGLANAAILWVTALIMLRAVWRSLRSDVLAG